MREETSAALDNRCWRWSGLILIAGAMLVQPAYAQTASIRKDSFETGTIQSAIWNVSDTDGCSTSVQTGDAADGRHYLRSTLTAKEGGGNFRCELRLRGVTTVPDNIIREGDTVYYGMSYRMPAATAYDSSKVDTMTQWFQQPNISLGGGTGTGGCHHVIQLEGTVMRWHGHNCDGVGGADSSLLTPVPKDTWLRVCAKYKWRTDNDGLIKIWINADEESDTPAKDYTGQTLVDTYTEVGMFKVGIYKTGWRTTSKAPNMAAMSPRIFDHDDIRVGKSFAEACGGGSDQAEPPIPVPKPPISVAVE